MRWTRTLAVDVDRVRQQTDESLRSERLKTDELLKSAAQRSHAVSTRAVRGNGYGELQCALERERHAEDNAVREERTRADELIQELLDGREAQAAAVARERTHTDRFLTEERESADLLVARFRVPFALLVEQVRDYAIFMLDREGKVISWNYGAQRLIGYPPEEILGKDRSVFFLEEDVNAGKPSEVLQIAAREGHFEEEGWRVRKDGTTFIANVIITPVMENGELAGFSVITRNVTERFRAEEAFRRSEERLRFTVEIWGLGMWDLDLTTGELVLSDRCKSIMGIDPSEPVTMDRFRAAIHPDDRGRTEEEFRRAEDPSSSGMLDIECRVLRSDGSVGSISAMGRVMFVGAGVEKTPRRFVGAVLDITSRRSKEA
jgi:PAS domain S-box-containing protein